MRPTSAKREGERQACAAAACSLHGATCRWANKRTPVAQAEAPRLPLPGQVFEAVGVEQRRIPLKRVSAVGDRFDTVVVMAIPFISVRHPRAHDIVDDPVEVAGIGTGFEGTLSARLRNAGGDEIAEKSFQAGGTGIWGNFFFRIDVPGVPNRARGTLEVFEISAEDGSELHKRVIPILFGRALVDPFQGFAVYTVRSGDTLSEIASEFYGDPAKFRVIFAANRHILDDPDVIVPGQTLRIPQ